MVDGGDPVLVQVGALGQVGAEDGVVGHVHEGNHGVPALVVVPHLQWETNRQQCEWSSGGLPKTEQIGVVSLGPLFSPSY